MSDSTLPEENFLRLLEDIEPQVDANTWRNPFWKILHNSAKSLCKDLSDARARIDLYEGSLRVNPDFDLEKATIPEVMEVFLTLVAPLKSRHLWWELLVQRISKLALDHQRLQAERSRLPPAPLTQDEVAAWTQRLRTFVLEAERNFVAKDPVRYSIAVDLRPTLMELILRLEGAILPRRSLPPGPPSGP